MGSQRLGDQTRRRELLREVAAEMGELQLAIDAAEQAMASYLGVNRTDVRSLDLLVRHGRLTAGQLAEALGLTPGSVTTLVDRLERAQYAERERDRENRSRVFIRPSPGLSEALGRLFDDRDEGAARQMDAYGPEQLLLVRDFLRQSRANQAAFATRLTSLPPNPLSRERRRG